MTEQKDDKFKPAKEPERCNNCRETIAEYQTTKTRKIAGTSVLIWEQRLCGECVKFFTRTLSAGNDTLSFRKPHEPEDLSTTDEHTKSIRSSV